jgi:two-component system sensor histidine kinase KdpD
MAPCHSADEFVSVSLIFLLITLLAAGLWGYSVGIAAAIASELLINFFFVVPVHTLEVGNARSLVELLVFLAVALVGATMLAMVRRQLLESERQRSKLATMLGVSRELASAPTPERALAALAGIIREAAGARGCTLLLREPAGWRIVASTGALDSVSRDAAAAADAAVAGGQPTRRYATRSSGPVRREGTVTDAFLPFASPVGKGVMWLHGPGPGRGRDQDDLLTALGDEAGVAVHREALAGTARKVEEVERAGELKSALLSSVSHDLRTPLASIKTAVGTLRAEGLLVEKADRDELLRIVESETDRLTRTVSELLEMSRLEGRAVQPRIESMDAAMLLGEAAEMVRGATGGREVRLDAVDGLAVRADHGLVVRALANLIENAAVHSTPGGRIDLSARGRDGRIELAVSDEGPGIPAADLPHVFEKFYRGSASKRSRGSGLGLAIVDAAARLCGGTASVHSSEQGTAFTLDLPAAPVRRQ